MSRPSNGRRWYLDGRSAKFDRREEPRCPAGVVPLAVPYPGVDAVEARLTERLGDHTGRPERPGERSRGGGGTDTGGVGTRAVAVHVCKLSAEVRLVQRRPVRRTLVPLRRLSLREHGARAEVIDR